MRKELLDRLAPVTGLNRSYLATALGNYDGRSGAAAKGRRKQRAGGKRGGRPVKYGAEFAKALENNNPAMNGGVVVLVR